MLTVGTDVERYRVEAVLGRGGAGTVYAVRHRTLDTAHALKVLHIASPAMQQRFIEEGRIQARLRHPNVLPVSDVLDLQGHPALLMDLVDGGSLADRLLESPMAAEEALRLARGIVRGVRHAHEERVLHRDLKPANVLLDQRDGTHPVPRVTDFGLARVLGGSHPSLTQMGAMLGTPAYMAPEQVHAPSAVDPRADIFSVGVMLHELFTGERPFVGATHEEIFEAAREGRFPPLASRQPALPPALIAVIEGCLAPQREARIASCEALLTALDAIRPGDFPEAILWRPAPPRSRAAAPSWEPSTDVAPVGGNDTLAGWLPDDDTPEADIGGGARVHPTPRTGPAPPTLPPVSTTAEAPGPPPRLADERSEDDASDPSAPAPAASDIAGSSPAARARAVATRALLLILPLLAASTGRLEAMDARLRWRLLRTAGQVVPTPDVGIVGIATADMRSLRGEHAGLLDALGEVGVRAVVFDLALTEPGPEDARIAAAAQRLTEAGTPVLMPVRFERGEAVPPGSSVLRDAVQLGAVESPQDLATGQVDRLHTLRWQADGSPLWSLPIATVAALDPTRSAPESTLDAVRVGEAAVPVRSGLMWLAPTAAVPVVRHDEPERLDRLAGRVVFIGAHGRDEDRVNTPGGTRWGVEVMAEATQLVLRDAVPTRRSTLADLLLVAVSAVATLGAGRRSLRAACIAGAATVGLGAGLVLSGQHVALLPALVASVIGAWASRSWRTRP